MYSIPQIKVVCVREAQIPAEKMGEPRMALKYWKENVETMPTFDPDKEHLIVFCLNSQFKVRGFNIVSVGSLNESIAHPREIFRPAIAAASRAIIMMHNHPSGETHPSDADRRLTQKVKEAGELLLIPLIDHIIVGGDNYFSFKESGLI